VSAPRRVPGSGPAPADPGGIDAIIARAYREDLGDRGDITSRAVVAASHRARASLVARQAGCVAGLGVAAGCFRHVDAALEVVALRADGDLVTAGTVLLTVEGRTRSILAAERVALNFLGRLSGIATETRRYVDAVAGTGAEISDTRKTTPGLRVLEKAAVAAGGGRNHRSGLYDAVLIKDNHLAATASIGDAVAAARRAVGSGTTVEVEVDTIDQLREVLETSADAVLLDNMSIEELREAVELARGRLRTEASGGVDLSTVRAIAETGIDVISVGRLTHSAPALDVALEVTLDGVTGVGARR
jgi:nicotinate-nucleotide pyrophosphorylase (carboxylating)